MQHIPPWDHFTTSSYCQAVNGWTVKVTSPNPVCMSAPTKIGCAGQPAVISTTYPVWSADHVFCLGAAGHLWQLLLYLALVGWVFFTAVSLLQTFEWRGMTGYSLGELVKTIGHQIGILVIACLSFSLLLAVHQLLFLLINGLVGGLPQWRVESLWKEKLISLVLESQNATQHLDPNGAIDQLFGGNLPDSSGPFGMTWGQVAGGLGSFETFVVSALVPIRFVAMLVAVISAPLAILCYSTHLTRRLFYIWLQFWAEIEGLAVGSAIVLAGYQQIHATLKAGHLAPTEQAYILLGLCGLVCGANLVFLWKIIGQFLSNITSFYQQQYQRERQLVGVLTQAAVGVLGALATAVTGGAALPAALAAEGLVSGVTNLGATPGGAAPGAGVGQAFISAGRASATNQRLQALEAEREERQIANQQAEDRYQAAQKRQQWQDVRQETRDVDYEVAHGRASRWPPPSGAGAPPQPPGGGSTGGSGGGAPFTGAAPQPQQHGTQAPGWGQPPSSPAQPPTDHQIASALLRNAQVDVDVRQKILAALPTSQHDPAKAPEEGMRLIHEYVAVAQQHAQVRQQGKASTSLIQALQRLAQNAHGEGEADA
jgi:hypothetical protein